MTARDLTDRLILLARDLIQHPVLLLLLALGALAVLGGSTTYER